MMWNLRACGRLAILLALALAVQALAGCSRPTGSVSGKVTYQGKPVAGGIVTFLGADNKVASSPIGPDGSYTIDRVGVGEAKVSVTPATSGSAIPKGMKMDPGKMGAPAGAAPPAGSDPGKPLVIPEKYRDAAKSGITYTVTAGAQQHDFDLK